VPPTAASIPAGYRGPSPPAEVSLEATTTPATVRVERYGDADQTVHERDEGVRLRTATPPRARVPPNRPPPSADRVDGAHHG